VLGLDLVTFRDFIPPRKGDLSHGAEEEGLLPDDRQGTTCTWERRSRD